VRNGAPQNLMYATCIRINQLQYVLYLLRFFGGKNVHPFWPLVLSLFLVSISQLGGLFIIAVMLQWMGGSRRKVYAVSIQSLP
jgi:hypothetical protein